MEGRKHSKVFFRTLPFLVIGNLLTYFLGMDLWKFTLQLILASSVYDPDEDVKWKNGATHRNGITHSILWNIIIAGAFYWFEPQYFLSALFVSFPATYIHLFLDLFAKNDEDNYSLFGSHRSGKWRIKLWKRFTTSGSTIWLILNLLIIIAYEVLFIVMV